MAANQTSAPEKSKADLAKKGLVGAGVLALVFLLGYVPSCLNARSVSQKNSRLNYQLQLAELRGQLGMMSYEVNRNNYGNAADISTAFFNGLETAIEQCDDDVLKQKLQETLGRRDEIIFNLAQADPAVKEKLAQMYAGFFQVTTAYKPE